ncbi:MAG: HAMP domain-containing protein [Acidimicrobiia bacterium]|nr:HAMP domain-containing protein [Acidimicrobiia bacterium]
MSRLRDWLTGTFAGRALLAGLLIKSATLTLAAAGVPLTGMLGLIDACGGIALLVGASVWAYRLFVAAKRRLLWRVRRKLTLSYIFIGVVPALLIICFFLLAGLLLFFNVSSYLMQSRIRALVDQTAFLAQTAALELQRSPGADAFAETLARRQAGAFERHPDTSYAVIAAERACGGNPRGTSAAVRDVLVAGPWSHLAAPGALPEWVTCAGYAGLIVYPDGTASRVAVRAVAFPPVAAPRYAVLVDLPLTRAIAEELRGDTGVELGDTTTLIADERGDPGNPDITVDIGGNPSEAAFPPPADTRAGMLRRPREWVVFLDSVDWDSGRPGTVTMAIRTTIADIYDRISATPVAQIGNFNFGQVLLILLGVVGGLFLVIQIVALGMGLGLARSITGSVHELFTGTERVRQGDFTHKISIRTRDQFGELADSFNSMTASVEELLQQKAEKERLEQELRIAREIQMSLLPQGPLRMPGLVLTAHCEPAREVGGDYYDVLPIDDHRLGILIADVAGKGTSAALYMAELKGLILALSQLHRSPRQLLIDANRIISRHLDRRSFITITYAVADLEARTLTHARAGHCPLLYRQGEGNGERRVRVLCPDGLVLGLQIDNGDMFTSLLEEVTVPIAGGDLFVLYTDGITEAMNAAGDCFGDQRLGALVEEHGDLPSDELRERILREIRSFVGGAPQQDDMTMLLMRVEA